MGGGKKGGGLSECAGEERREGEFEIRQGGAAERQGKGSKIGDRRREEGGQKKN